MLSARGNESKRERKGMVVGKWVGDAEGEKGRYEMKGEK